MNEVNQPAIEPVTDEAGERVPMTKTAQVRMCGNSVAPACAQALVAANYVAPMIEQELAA